MTKSIQSIARYVNPASRRFCGLIALLGLSAGCDGFKSLDTGETGETGETRRNGDVSTGNAGLDWVLQAPLAPDTLDETGDSWVVGLYIAADNNLDPYAVGDLNELIGEGVPAGVTVLALVDRSPSYGLRPIDGDIGSFEDTRLLRIDSTGASVEDATLGELDSAQTSTIKVLIDAMVAEEAARNMFIFWDHGGGTVFASDETSDSHALDLHDLMLSFAKDESDLEKGFHTMDLLGFDACLMSTIEALIAAGPVAPAYVASAETEPGNGWDYAALMRTMGTADLTPRMVAQGLVQGYEDFYTGSKAGNTTLTAWHTDSVELIEELSALNAAVEQQRAIDPNVNLYLTRHVGGAVGVVTSYGASGARSPVSVDFGGFLRQAYLQDVDCNPDNIYFCDLLVPVQQAADALHTELLSLRLAYWSKGAPGAMGLGWPVGDVWSGGGLAASSASGAVGGGELVEGMDGGRALAADADAEPPLASVTTTIEGTDALGYPTLQAEIEISDDVFVSRALLLTTLNDIETMGDSLLLSFTVLEEAAGESELRMSQTLPLWTVSLSPTGVGPAGFGDVATVWHEEGRVHASVRIDVGGQIHDGNLVLEEDGSGRHYTMDNGEGLWSMMEHDELVALGASMALVRFEYDEDSGALTPVVGNDYRLADAELTSLFLPRGETTLTTYLDVVDVAGEHAMAVAISQ